jgi:uncharacterized lipoprotein YajG
MKKFFLLVTAAAVLASCAPTQHKKIVAPSTAPTQHAINSASDANASAQVHNTKARSLNDRIDAKDAIIDQWHREHPGQ